MKLKKSSVCYLTGISILSIIQLILAYGFLSTERTIGMSTDLYVDGTDFSPFLSLVDFGLGSIVYLISIVIDVIFGALLSLIVMRILRRVSLRFFTMQTKKTGLIITLICGIIFLLIGCVLVKFKLLPDLLILYLPVLIISFFAYNFGKQPKQK